MDTGHLITVIAFYFLGFIAGAYTVERRERRLREQQHRLKVAVIDPEEEPPYA